MPDLQRLFAGPYIYLLFGLFFIFMTLGWTFQGKIRVRAQGWVYRTEEPTQFWLRIALWFLGGIGFVGYSLFQVYKGSY